jgi:hypothetical protein
MAETEKGPFAGLTITKDMTFEQILELARKEYGYIDTIFQTVPELKKLLRKAVKNKYQAKQFQQEFTSTDWFISTGAVMQKRGFEMRQYNELVNKINSENPGKTSEEINAIVDAQLPDSNYARGVESVKNSIKAQALSRNLKYTEEELNTWAKEIYNGGYETDQNFIKIYLNTKGTFGVGAAATGVGAANIDAIRDYAGSQGFDLEKDFSAATMQGWQQRLDMGDSIAAIKKEIETRAMIGQPTSVQNLMSSQGLTLTDIYNPFVQRAQNRTGNMNLTFKDEWFAKNIFNDKGEIDNYFEFDKKLMTHPDWEYGPEAKEKVSSSALRILQDMGLMGG